MELYNEEIERAELYKLFSSLFMKEPPEDILVELKDMFQMRFNDTQEEIASDFALLFLGTDPHLSPHESLHRYALEETPKLWGSATKEVQTFYRSVQLMVDEEMALIPDHLTVELLFMSYLVENNFVEQQKAFMEKHLMQWVPDYCGEIESHARTTFYVEIAVLVREFIISDHEKLSGGS